MSEDIYFENPAVQLRYFIKSLLETSCFEVWIYSPIQNRCIRQTEENYVRFLGTEWMAITKTDNNDILNLLSNFPQSNDEIKQTLLFVSFQKFTKELKDASTFATKLLEKKIQQKIQHYYFMHLNEIHRTLSGR